MSVERTVMEETLEDLEEDMEVTVTDLEKIRGNRDKYSTALSTALYRHHDRLDVQLRLLREIIAEADRRKDSND